jgi:hypothetical protein
MRSTWKKLLAALVLVGSGAGAVVGTVQAQEDDWDDWGDEGPLPVEIHGFAEAAAGGRVVADPASPDDLLLNEARFRLDLAHYGDRADMLFKGDFLADGVLSDVEIDIRQVMIVLRAAHWLDVRAGRQVLTWGTGDLLFLNDAFPKDWQSFFIGRDDEYLKAPSNSFKFTFYSALNLDLVWTPAFTPDDYITGERLSYFNPLSGAIESAATTGGPIDAETPDKKWENGEFAGRLFKTVNGWELALYGYAGFWKRPLGVDTTRADAGSPLYFPRLTVAGASVRGNVLGGVGNVEGAYYDSWDDKSGTDPFIPNSEVRGLAGYERELFPNFNLGLQYYVEWWMKYDNLIANSPVPQWEQEEARHLLTARLTQRLKQDTWTLSLFTYWSPNEEDGYIRPVVSHKWSDAVTVTLGGNVMWGKDHTFFGQLEDNSNVYARLRYSF